MIHDPIPRSDEAALPLFDAEALDIADYLKAEPEAGDIHLDETRSQGLAALTLGAIGVVYGDIGTSPIYAFREAIKATGAAVPGPAEVLGILSLLIWTLILIVTVKYVFFLLRADNRGEGGILALYTLVRLATGRRSVPVLLLALAGAALFAGDAAITPAISVLSAVEGFGLILPQLSAYVLPVTIGILIALFMVQRQGPANVARFFGPVCVVWFLALGGLGLWHIADDPSVLASFKPAWGVTFLLEHPGVAFIVLGAVFLAVTGGEALYADLGHVPSALMHNIKHNRVLHEQTVLLTVETLRVPYATAEERATVEPLGGCFLRVVLRFGFMETPNISRAMAHARRAGLKFDVMASTFFLGRRRAVATGSGLELVMDRIYVALARLAADPTDFYHLPRDRVVELGERVAI